jgi:citrate/tricarballylate utilization protein
MTQLTSALPTRESGHHRTPSRWTLTEVMRKAEHEMVVCNACRYCEAYCPVFHAMEQRVTFQSADLTYLANLCHNCGECLYACQYAPPHEFNIDVPRTFSRVRVESYESFAWPSFASIAFRRPWSATFTALAAGALTLAPVARAFMARATTKPAAFYAVIPHDVMVTIFGVIGLFVVAAIAIGHRRFAGGVSREGSRDGESRSRARATRDVLSLKHLHATGEDCVDAEEQRRPWRRWLHHCTFYGFALCFASTTVAAIYHAFGWIAPYAYTSAPVVLGTVGGLGLVIGPAGLLMLDQRRYPALTHASERALGFAFLTMLLLTSVTGLLLLALRERPYMPTLLVIHLAIVLALFITFPYGKFVHGIYRSGALLKFRREESL